MYDTDSPLGVLPVTVGRTGRSYAFSAVSGFLGLTPEAKTLSYPAFVQSTTMELVRDK